MSLAFVLLDFQSDVLVCASGAMNTVTRCSALKFSCIMFHSLIHAYMYINDTYNFYIYLARTSCHTGF